jgi:hypothetical protein
VKQASITGTCLILTLPVESDAAVLKEERLVFFIAQRKVLSSTDMCWLVGIIFLPGGFRSPFLCPTQNIIVASHQSRPKH